MNWKIVLILVILITGVFAAAYFINPGTALAMRVKVEIEGNMSSADVKNIDAELIEVQKAKVQQSDDFLRFPSVSIYVIENMRVVSYIRQLDYKGSGIYEADIGMLVLPRSNKVRIIVQVFDKFDSTLIGVKKDVILNQTIRYISNQE